MNLTSGGIHSREAIRGSFTLWDLVAILGVLLIVGTWYGFNHTGERGRIARCASNLRTLGEAAQSFANDHQNELPPALINMSEVESWDMALVPYLNPKFAKAKRVYEKVQLMADAQRYFVCPSDPIQRADPRSYSMAGRDMNYGWPPTSDDKTGLGIIWNRDTVPLLHNNELVANATNSPDLFPRIKQSVLLDPANTLLLTELIQPDNIMAKGVVPRVFSVIEQQRSFIGQFSHFHFDKFNYLMADGHVELLTARQTEGDHGKGHNIWTINSGD